jgi:hypothetical protein
MVNLQKHHTTESAEKTFLPEMPLETLVTNEGPALVTRKTWFQAQSRQGDVFLIRIGDVGCCDHKGAEVSPTENRVELATGLSSHTISAASAQVFERGFLTPKTLAHVLSEMGEGVRACLERTTNQLIRVTKTSTLDHSNHHGSIPLCPGDYIQPWQLEDGGTRVQD